MATEAYMLSRDQEESQRLDAQHKYLRQLANGKLIQPSVPQSELKAIADIGTGTGIWLREVAQELESPNNEVKFMGFDISAQQFPKSQIDGITFIEQDIVKPFAPEFHEKFDLVHVRFLSYALKAQDLESAVRNVIQILHPGGYLQWQETDAIDGWASPETPNAKATVSYIVSERIARGLTPAITMPLVKAIQSFSMQIPAGSVSPLSWTGDLMRILHMDTFSTMNHASPIVNAGARQVIKIAAVPLLRAGISRRKAVMKQTSCSQEEMQELERDTEAIGVLLDAWNQGTDPACNEWNFAITSIVARKAVFINEEQNWMMAKG